MIGYAVLGGFVLDAVFGDPVWLPHPVVYMGKAISALEKGLRARLPKTPKGELWGGRILAFCLPVGTFAITSLVCMGAAALHPLLGLAEQLPGAQILNEDGSNRDFLLSEGLESTEAFVALTNIDEENVLLTLFAKKHSRGKLVTKINRLEFDDILAGLDLGSIVYPKYMTCDYIVQYVRALQNEAGNNIKTLYRILDDRVEALEFTVHEESRATGVPLSQLHLKKNLLLCCITRGDNILIPRGGDQIQVGDNVIVVTLEHGLHDLRDIVEE